MFPRMRTIFNHPNHIHAPPRFTSTSQIQSKHNITQFPLPTYAFLCVFLRTFALPKAASSTLIPNQNHQMDEKCNIVSLEVGGEIKDGKEPALNDLPVIATRNLVLFPDVVIPIALVSDNARMVAEAANEQKIPVGVFLHTSDPEHAAASEAGIFRYGVLADVIQVLDIPGGGKTALMRGHQRLIVTGKGEGRTLPVSELNIQAEPAPESTAMARGTRERIEELRKCTAMIAEKTDGMGGVMLNIDPKMPPAMMVNTIATHVPVSPEGKMAMLAAKTLTTRSKLLMKALEEMLNQVELANDIRERARQEMNEQNRHAFLAQQMNIIKEELYGSDNDDVETLRKKLEETQLPESTRRTVGKEIDKLARLNPSIPDYTTLLTYLETVLDLPWGVKTELNTDFGKAAETLENEHYGLEKVKERIMEQLAVMMHNPGGRSPIICLVGAPGVGKTSLGQSVARALGRKYQRVSLGGLHDEAEIRGHRRTYIGAMPGRIIDAIRRSKSSNPVILLDEVDKIGADFKGDPSAALLEVLDPEQNCKFHDNYIDVDFDLSDVLFIATANTLSTMSQPLLDRMEIIDIDGYSLEEKMEIARRHLLPRQLERNSMQPDSVRISDEALAEIIGRYTGESGVRQLEKALAAIVRKVILRQMKGEPDAGEITPAHLKDLLGLPRHRSDRYEGNEFPGVVTGLAWTAAGGEILFIESSLSEGKGEKLTLTGNLGDVMKESAAIALQYVRANAGRFGIPAEKFADHNLHIHVPEGAIPKDGPSAGITMATSIVSAFTGRKVKEKTAMTGEITLRGKVLPVGGIKEKLLAARRAGIDHIVISSENRPDVEEIDARYMKDMTFTYVDTVNDVIEAALLP